MAGMTAVGMEFLFVRWGGTWSTDWKSDESYGEPFLDKVVIVSQHFIEHALCAVAVAFYR